MKLARPSRLELFPLIYAAALLNPYTYFVLHLTRTYSWVIPFSVALWIIFDWESLKKHPDILRPPSLQELLTGVAIIAAAVGNCLLQEPSSRIFGAFDSLAVFIGLCLLLFGYRSLRPLWVPAVFLLVLGSGYKIEQILVNRSGYDKWLAGSVASIAHLLVPQLTSQGNKILLPRGDPSYLVVDYGCTGIKAILAFSFITFVPIISSRRGAAPKIFWILLTAAGFWVWSVVRLVLVSLAVLKWGWPALRIHTMIGFSFFLGWLILVVYLASSPRSSDQGP